jgi:hypothetical protein
MRGRERRSVGGVGRRVMGFDESLRTDVFMASSVYEMGKVERLRSSFRVKGTLTAKWHGKRYSILLRLLAFGSMKASLDHKA